MTMTCPFFKPSLAVALLLFVITSTTAQVSGSASPRPKSIFDVLTQVEAARMTLETDLTTVIEQKKTTQYFPATLRTEDGKVYRTEIKSRGKFRRKIAAFPPLKLKFKKKDLTAEGLDTLNEVKLVLPCFENDLGDELIVREYLAYRMYESLTDVSIKARLIRLNIRDTHVEKTKRTMFAILLEDEEELVARLNCRLHEDYGIPFDSLHTGQTAMMVMFQYMIGNTDWEIAMLRNVRLLRPGESGKLLAVPYDFDFAGLVAAPYASPNSETGLKTVRDRFLMNNGLKTEALKRALATMRASKQTLLAVCRSKYLDNDASDDMTNYIRSFFDRVDGKTEIPQLLKIDSD